MLPPYRSSAVWISGNKFDPESEQGKSGSIQLEGNDWDMIGPVMQYSQPQWLQRQLEHRKLWQAGLLLLSLAVLHCVYLGAFSPCKFKTFNSNDQTPILHFSTPTGMHNPPTGLFFDDKKIWHMYFQCQLCVTIQ